MSVEIIVVFFFKEIIDLLHRVARDKHAVKHILTRTINAAASETTSMPICMRL